MAGFVICAVVFTTYKVYDNYQMSKKFSSLMLENLAALSENENNNPTWHRVDEDCEYIIYGSVGGKVDIKIAGATVATLKIGVEGYVKYVYSKGSTCCSSGGNEQCTARYCPPLG